MPEEMRTKRLSRSGGEHVSSSDTAKATPTAIREALQHIPNPDLSWDAWKRVLMATFAASHGDEDAYFDFLDWSRKSKKNNDTVTRKEWTSCRASPPRSLGFGTLHYLATQNGWVPSAGLTFNTAKDVSDVDISGFDAMPFADAVEAPNMQTPSASIQFQHPSQPAQPYRSTTDSIGIPVPHEEISKRLLEVEWEGSYSDAQPRRRDGSVRLNSHRGFPKWTSASVMLPPSRWAAG